MKRKNICKFIIAIIIFIAVLVLSVYLIYILPESLSTLQSIITTIVAAVYGGLLTLVGVAWTIKKSEADKKETNRRLATPFFGVVDGISLDTIDANRNSKQFVKPNGGDCNMKFVCNLINSDKNTFYIDKIQIKSEDYFSDSKLLIKKDEVFSICIMDKKDIILQRQTIRMFVTDMNYEQRVFDIIYGENGEYNQIVEVVQ